MFATLNAHRTWNTRYSGKEAFTRIHCRGYLAGSIHDRDYLAHRVLWLLATGDWPIGDIDHINGIKNDNRFVNLRSVSHSSNMKNQRIRSSNSSGVMGVCWNASRGKWVAQITVDSQGKFIGMFDSFDAAVAARKAAEERHGFHPNHGRAA